MVTLPRSCPQWSFSPTQSAAMATPKTDWVKIVSAATLTGHSRMTMNQTLYPMAVQTTASASSRNQACGGSVVAALQCRRPVNQQVDGRAGQQVTAASIFITLARATIGLPMTE